MSADTATGTALPIEMRRTTAQLIRLELGLWWWTVPSWVLIMLPTALARSEWPGPWAVAALVVTLVVVVAIDVRKRRKEVLLLTEHGLYVGRDDGKKLGWLAPKPIELPWGVIRGVRIIENRWSRKVIVDNTGLSRLLPYPMSTWTNPDPELDHRVELIRRTWTAQRGPLPPPPAPPWLLPIDPPGPPAPPG